MSRETELADKFAMSKFASSADREAAMLDEFRRLDRVNAELVEAINRLLVCMRLANWENDDSAQFASAALTSATKETK